MERPDNQPRFRRPLVVALATVLAFALASGSFIGCADPARGGADGTGSPSWSQRSESGFSAEPSLQFRTPEKLQEHFEKHGWETGCGTAEEYLAAANSVVANPESLHKLQREDGDDLYFLEDTGEFVVVSPAGYLRTYFLTDRGYFDRQ